MQKKSSDAFSGSSLLLVISILIVALFLAVGCATNPPNIPLCVEINPGVGNCVKIMSGESFDVDDKHPFEGKTWWESRPSMIQLPASSWAQMKAFIIKMCKQTKQCDKNVSSWDRTIQNVDEQVQKKQ